MEPTDRIAVGPSNGPPNSAPPELLARAARGDESAWRDVVSAYARRIFSLAQSRLGDRDLAEEVTQAVFVTIASKLGTGGYAEQGKFEPWLFRIAMNRVRDEVRRRRRGGPEPLHSDAVASTSRSGTEHSAGALRAALASLGEGDREIIELRHHAGLSFARIAELLDEPLGTLLARHHRALRKLRAILEPDSASPRARRTHAEEPIP